MKNPYDAAIKLTSERLRNANHGVSSEAGKAVGEYIEAIYNKLVELEERELNRRNSD